MTSVTLWFWNWEINLNAKGNSNKHTFIRSELLKVLGKLLQKWRFSWLMINPFECPLYKDIYIYNFLQASLVPQMLKSLPAMQETWVKSLCWEDPLEEGMATHSSILAWRIPWAKKPGGLQSMKSHSAGHSWATNTFHKSLGLSPLLNPVGAVPGFIPTGNIF